MLKRVSHRFMVLWLGLSLFIFAGAQSFQPWRGVSSSAAQEALPIPRIQILRSDERGVLLSVETPAFSFERQQQNGQEFDVLSLPAAGVSARSGSPQMPLLSAMLGAPAGVTFKVKLLQEQVERIAGRYTLLPAPYPSFEEGDQQAEQVYQPDSQVYASDRLYPESPVRLAQDGWLRDQRFVRLEFFPFQYRAASGELIWRRFMLVELSFGGQAQSLGSSPAPDAAFESLYRQSLLNYESAKAWRARSTVEKPLSVRAASAARYKIVVKQDGLYRLTYADLAAAGVPATTLDTLDPRSLTLSNLGLTLAITVTGEADGHFDQGDAILFYGEKFNGDRFAARYPDYANLYWLLNNCLYTYCPPQLTSFAPDEGLRNELYTDENVYWLEIGDQPGLRMAQINGAHQPGIAVADAYTETARYETAERVYLIHFTEEDIFFSRRIQTVSFPYTVTFPVTLTALAAGSFNAVVRGDVVARAASTSSPDHHTRITMNNSPQVVEDAAWDAYNTPVRHVFEGTVSQSALQEGANLLNLGIYRAALSREDLYFNWYEVEYARRFQADRDQLAFRASGGPGRQGYTVSGFSAGDLWVLDVTVPFTPTLVTNALVAAGQSYTVTFDVTQQAGGRFFVAADGALKSPVSITPYTPPDLLAASPGANYLIITHSDFITAAQRLADYRRDGTLTPRVVDVTDVYNLFADGIQHPLAIKNFLRYAYNNWTVRPEYVILVGDGHWNPRRYPIVQGNGQPFGWRPVTMLPYMALVDPWQGIVDSANLLATVAGDDILPDVLISRMIVTSNAELEGIVDKIIAYESASLPPEQQRLIFVADDPDTAGDFPTEAEKVIAGIPSRYPIDRFYLPNYLGQPGCGASDTACLPIKEDIITHTLNISGALFLNYLGHGDFPSWSAPQTMYYNDVAAFRNPQPLPVSVDMTCLTGYWFWPAQPDDVVNLSLAVRMLRQPIYGTVSGYAPTGLGLGMAHQVLHKAFYRAVYRDELGLLGPATQASKLALYQEGAYYDLIHTFTLFGDPALKLAVPLHRPGLTANGAITQTVTPGVTVQYDLTVANLGTEADTYTITALAEGSLGGEAWPAALSAVQVGPLAPGEQQALTVLVTVPQDALQFSAQDVQIAVVSQLNPLQQAAQSLHTEVLIRYGLAVNPLHDERIGIPGYTVNYPVAVTNTGNTPASFDVEIVSGWPVNLDPAPPLQLAVNETRAALVEIEIPPETPLGSQNITVLQITPRGAASIQETVVLTTIVQAEIAVQLAPLIAYGAGKPGSSVLFPLTITNTGNYTDVFELTAAGWPVSFSPSTTATLGSGDSFAVQANVHVLRADAMGNLLPWGLERNTYVEVRSRLNPAISQVARLDVTVDRLFGLQSAPGVSALSADPGSTVTYTLALTNTGNYTDTFTVQPSALWPVDVSPTPPLVLAAGERAAVQLVVRLPADALYGASDQATLTVRSQDDPALSTAISFTTTAQRLFGLRAASEVNALSGDPGSAVTYTLALTNTGNYTDTFTVQPSALWPADVLPTPPLVLAAGERANVQLVVRLPADALYGASDQAALTVRSQDDPALFTVFHFTTTAQRLFDLQFTPGVSALSADPGSAVTYTLALTNTGNYTDTFTVQPSALWPADVSPTPPLVLAAGERANVQLVVHLPANALYGASDQASLTVRSQGNPARSAMISFTTTAQRTVGVLAVVLSDRAAGRRGDVVNFTVVITNTGNAPDQYLVASTPGWSLEFDPLPPLGPLPSGGHITLQAAVQIPPDALAGSLHQEELQIVSLNDPSQKIFLTLQIDVLLRNLFLPMVRNEN